jgi:hypothetical protein
MNVNCLYQKLENLKNLYGDCVFQKNHIIWSYEFNDEFDCYSSCENFDDFDYSSLDSREENLLEIYNSDIIKIENLLDGIGEYGNFTISNPEMIDNLITFKIY